MILVLQRRDKDHGPVVRKIFEHDTNHVAIAWVLEFVDEADLHRIEIHETKGHAVRPIYTQQMVERVSALELVPRDD